MADGEELRPERGASKTVLLLPLAHAAARQLEYLERAAHPEEIVRMEARRRRWVDRFELLVKRRSPFLLGDVPVATADRRVRFTAAGLAANRKRLGLSAADFGRLVGTTGQSIYAWEGGSATPRAKNLAAIAELRSLGKKAVAARLAALSQE